MARTPSTSVEFARAFGDALREFLNEKQISQSKAARLLDIGRARLNTYCHDSPSGTRSTPDAEILYKVCALLGFELTYRGFRITASTFDGIRVKQIDAPAEQLLLDFERQFHLTDETGTVSVSFRRPAGRVEVSLSLKAVS